jgi:hypothetical protein
MMNMVKAVATTDGMSGKKSVIFAVWTSVVRERGKDWHEKTDSKTRKIKKMKKLVWLDKGRMKEGRWQRCGKKR